MRSAVAALSPLVSLIRDDFAMSTWVLAALGMVRHWFQERAAGRAYKYGLFVAMLGLALTAFILVSMVIIKFRDGGWITPDALIMFECADQMIERLDREPVPLYSPT